MDCTALAASRQTELATLASEINAHHQAAEEAAFSALDHARAAGDLLIEAKTRCGHGTWSAWLVANFRGSERTAQRYMKLATGWAELEAKTTRVSDLSLREAVKLLEVPREAKPSPQADEVIWPFELRPGAVLRTIGEPDALVEIVPSIKHPGYYYLELYRYVSTAGCDLIYMKKPAKFDERLLNIVLANRGFRQTHPWRSFPMLSAEEPYYTRPDAQPGAPAWD